MSTKATLEAGIREERGKGAARRLRASGRVPAVVYGTDEETISVHLDAHDTVQLFQSISIENTIVELRVEGEDAPFDTLVREVQAHHLRPEVLHVDFMRVQAGVMVEVQVPVHFHGTPLGVRQSGGLLEAIVHDIGVRCLPSRIPEEISVDVSGLDINDTIHASDLEVDEDIELLIDPEQTICTVALPRMEEEEEEDEDEDDLEVALVGEDEEGEGASADDGSEDDSED